MFEAGGFKVLWPVPCFCTEGLMQAQGAKVVRPQVLMNKDIALKVQG